MLNLAKNVVKVALVSALLVLVGGFAHERGKSEGRSSLQRHAVSAGVGAHLLDMENGKIVFCWLTPFGPVPYYTSSVWEGHGVIHQSKPCGEEPQAPKCDKCCPCCDCGCQKGGPCKCEGKCDNECGPCKV